LLLKDRIISTLLPSLDNSNYNQVVNRWIYKYIALGFEVIYYFTVAHRVMMFIVGLPVAQIVLFCLSVGKDPHGLHLAIVNHETNNKTCPPTGSCELTQLSCQFLHQIELRRQVLVSDFYEFKSLITILSTNCV